MSNSSANQQNPLINFRQTPNFCTLILSIANINRDSLHIDFEDEKTTIKITDLNFTSTISHPPTVPRSNRYSISAGNLVILLKKHYENESYEWQSILIDNHEKWFLTKDNVKRCAELAESDSRWNHAAIAPKITSMRAFHDRDGILVQIETTIPAESTTNT
ncbi:5325_t:CDS:2 [Ambispora gerdemannii]|uniref:5325_t:CDS:1 n=1 Tax=Ambispora gerdemannii TaxID=144530 RepID=A0A9N9G047_9GLOM|nr:5325_t:CDS:2 [Ambispora gerdemannii]